MNDATSDAPETEEAQPDHAPTTPLTEPAEGVPPVIDTPEALALATERFGRGTGPVAADAERASGFRYGQATYLVQFKRRGAGLVLIDTAALPDLSEFGAALGDAEWVLHAASQDLPGMRELGMEPARIFDTELAARILGWPKVGLASVVERELGLTLAKEHSAQDWSTRPLPPSWLTYAALDVEVLIELRDAMRAHLMAAGKLEWAEQEFEAVRTAPPPEPRVDPWRRTNGCHQVRDQRGMAIVRSLWEARDREARRRDTSPGRVLRDQAIIAAAIAKPTSLDALLALREWQSKGTKRRAPQWYPAIEEAMQLPDKQLPAKRGPRGDGPPQPRMWADKRPEAHARLLRARAVITELSATHDIPAENLLQPDALRRCCWEYDGGKQPWIRTFLAGRGARPWQIDLVAGMLEDAFTAAALDVATVAVAEAEAEA